MAFPALPEVRVDLQAGAFLDPLPFDQAFLITGRIPVSTQRVEIEYHGSLEPIVSIGADPRKLEIFAAWVRAYLDTVQAAGTGDLPTLEAAPWREELTHLLIAVARTPEPRSRPLRFGALAAAPARLAWKYAMPWNWGNWAELFRERTDEVVAPGTLFARDPSRVSAGNSWAGRMEAALAVGSSAERARSLEVLAGEAVAAARTAHIAAVPLNGPPSPLVRWQRLPGAAEGTASPVRGLAGIAAGEARLEPAGGGGVPLPTASPGARWNRLERSERWTAEGMEFRALVPALTAKRYYLFSIRFERYPTEAEGRAFKKAATRRLDVETRSMEHGSLARVDGERVRLVLFQALKETVGGRIAAPAACFDLDVPYEEAEPQLIPLLAPVLELQAECRTGSARYAGWQASLESELDRLRTSPELAALVSALEAKRAVNASFGKYLSALPVIEAETGPTAVAVPGRLVLGTGAALQAVNARLEGVWTSDQVGIMARSLQQIRQPLQQLQLVLDDLTGDAARVGQLELEMYTVRDLMATVRRGIGLCDDMGLLLADFKAVVENRRVALEAMVAVFQRVLEHNSIENRTTLLVDTMANNYVSADAGLVYAGALKKASVYLGTNLYLRPVDKGVPLSQKGGVLRRFAFNVGLTLQSIADDRRTRDDLFLNQALVLGAGYRLSQYLRAGGGALVFWERDPDTFPLTRTRRAAMTPYVGLSFDLDMGSQLKGIGSLFDFLKRKKSS